MLEGLRLENVDIGRYFMAIRNIVHTDISNIMSIWYIFSCFGIIFHEKSGNPEVKLGERVLTSELTERNQIGQVKRLWPFGILFGDLVYFFRFGILYQGKSGNPDPNPFLSK
jgi:hypothetical protein